MKQLLYIFLSFLIVGCSSSDNSENSTTAVSFEVKYFGALKNIMHEGDLSAKADLADFAKMDHLYAIGAMENLKGEIQIFDGHAYNTYVEDSALVLDPSFDKKASLLVYATVEQWQEFTVPNTVETKNQLEEYIAATAAENGIDIHSPFPFILDGNANSIHWHVINWKDGDTEHSHEKHIQSGLHGVLKHTDARFLGFYSDAHHTIFTHHTTNMHIHVKTKDNMIAGHVDDLTLGEGMILSLPKTK